MEGSEYLKKTDLRDYQGEQALDIPLDWFKGQGSDIPMVVKVSHNAEATEPAPKKESARFAGK